jgi:hypothetical protein
MRRDVIVSVGPFHEKFIFVKRTLHFEYVHIARSINQQVVKPSLREVPSLADSLGYNRLTEHGNILGIHCREDRQNLFLPKKLIIGVFVLIEMF